MASRRVTGSPQRKDFIVPVSMGTASGAGILVPIHLETAPDVLAPGRLGVSVRIPLDAIRALTPPPPDCFVSAGARQVPAHPDPG
jgi:hypothetical protein